MSEIPKSFKKILSPSILAADHAALADGLKIVQENDLEWIHLDIMDGNFVPNISFGPGVVKALRSRDKKLFFDTHLMLARPDKYIEKFADAGADLITIHVEPDYPKAETLLRIRALGKQAGISLNPDTPADTLLPYLDKVDLVLVMSVFPGFGGQKFIADVLPKIEQLAKWREERGGTWRIEVDGGVDANTAPLCLAAGADTLVAGTAFFNAPDKPTFIRLCQGE
ncbi:MAG: ribulose-phosphate 3-epimerase [Opitutales bacterium]|nr:ribulose-phosphate 3-epimerase [Opitutales bacterium]